MAIEIVDLPIENGGSFHSYVNVYQRVDVPGSTERGCWDEAGRGFLAPAHWKGPPGICGYPTPETGLGHQRWLETQLGGFKSWLMVVNGDYNGLIMVVSIWLIYGSVSKPIVPL